MQARLLASSLVGRPFLLGGLAIVLGPIVLGPGWPGLTRFGAFSPRR